MTLPLFLPPVDSFGRELYLVRAEYDPRDGVFCGVGGDFAGIDIMDEQRQDGSVRPLSYSQEPVERRSRLLLRLAELLCIGSFVLLFVESDAAWIPGVLSAILGVLDLFARRRVSPRTSLDTEAKIVVLFGIACILPMVWQTWKSSGWAQPKSSRQADELMDRGKMILRACRTYTLNHAGLYPRDLSTLVRDGLVSEDVVGSSTSTQPSDAEIESSSEFLYFGVGLDADWAASRQVILLLSRKSFEKYGGAGRAVGYGDGQSGFCFDRDISEVLAECNRVRLSHRLPPLKLDNVPLQ